MAIIDAEGLFGGERLAALSDKARLYWPWLYTACNGYARMEMNPRTIIRRCFSGFQDPMTEQQLIVILSEYVENYLAFVYETDGQQWLQFDTPAKLLPRHKTKKDESSPNPSAETRKAFDAGYLAWKRRKSLPLLYTRENRELFRGDARGIGIGIGIGVGIGEGNDNGIVSDPITPPPIDPEKATHESQIRDAIERLFAYYCDAFERNPRQYALTPARRDKAEARMGERIRANLGDIAKAEMDLIRAVENLSMSEYHRTNGYIDWIEQIFRSQEEFEKRLNWIQPRGGQNGSTQQGTAQRSSPAVERQRESQRNIADAVRRRRSDGAWPNDVAVAGDEAKPDATARDAGSLPTGMGGVGGGVRHGAPAGRPVASAAPVIILPAAH